MVEQVEMADRLKIKQKVDRDNQENLARIKEYFLYIDILFLLSISSSEFKKKSKKIKRIIQLVRSNLMLRRQCHIRDHTIIKIPFQSIHQFRKITSFWTMTGSRLPSLSRLNIISLMPIYKKVSKI